MEITGISLMIFLKPELSQELMHICEIAVKNVLKHVKSKKKLLHRFRFLF